MMLCIMAMMGFLHMIQMDLRMNDTTVMCCHEVVTQSRFLYGFVDGVVLDRFLVASGMPASERVGCVGAWTQHQYTRDENQ